MTLGFWYGAKLIRDESFNIGNLIIVSSEHRYGQFAYLSVTISSTDLDSQNK